MPERMKDRFRIVPLTVHFGAEEFIDGVTIDYVQIFVSCYVYCGGTKEEALDIVFVKKIFCKLKGREGDYIATGLSRLDEKSVNLYGKSAFRYTRAEIKKEIEKMEKAKKKGMDA